MLPNQKMISNPNAGAHSLGHSESDLLEVSVSFIVKWAHWQYHITRLVEWLKWQSASLTTYTTTS
jgi:hypothetical protein